MFRVVPKISVHHPGYDPGNEQADSFQAWDWSIQSWTVLSLVEIEDEDQLFLDENQKWNLSHGYNVDKNPICLNRESKHHSYQSSTHSCRYKIRQWKKFLTKVGPQARNPKPYSQQIIKWWTRNKKRGTWKNTDSIWNF